MLVAERAVEHYHPPAPGAEERGMNRGRTAGNQPEGTPTHPRGRREK